MKILITGGAGFIGSNFIRYIWNRNSKIKVLNIDKLTYAGNLLNLKPVENNKHYSFIKGDIANRKLINKIFSKHKIDTILNFAA